ncbi:hypothetical protein GCM10010441_14540 [Kitasatospora paracochleata]|uniref:Uncharacterized protein n=1 Tax=Kitasatospora paracochleata TaxID=58354 RepID=A0ABT1ISE9_9ACTN|nr:hypothetical protein [Kitasatospora paracochleata]MCP2308060.1 hypothetical protein [Kitasatospora paracochleata]
MAAERPRRTESPWPWNARRELMARVRDAYGDPARPQRAFARTVERTRPYAPLVAELAALGELTDDTDINCEVCFSYLLEADPALVVRLSMVGPYALLGRARADGGLDLVGPDADDSGPVEPEVLRLLARHGLKLLSPAQLTDPVDLALPDVGRPTVYSALFAPEEETPPR